MAGINIGPSKESIEAAKEAVLQILSTYSVGDSVKKQALKALTKMTSVTNTTITNCTITSDKE